MISSRSPKSKNQKTALKQALAAALRHAGIARDCGFSANVGLPAGELATLTASCAPYLIK
jgi:hypothetical protein